VLTDELRYRILQLLAANPRMSQRDVARELGISLGRANHCVKSLMEKGWIKVSNFRNSRNKAAYIYLLTPRGIEAKAGVTMRFLQAKLREYETLCADIERIRAEVESQKRN
jgi:MarR family transcriptional regulator, temperature-dependent positive regulator of motility